MNIPTSTTDFQSLKPYPVHTPQTTKTTDRVSTTLLGQQQQVTAKKVAACGLAVFYLLCFLLEALY